MIEAEYAKAIYDLAVEEHKEEKFVSCFETIIESLKDNDFQKVLTSPFIQSTEKKKIIEKIFSELEKTFVDFLYVLIDNHRFDRIDDIYDEYNRLLLEQRDIIKIEVHSAVPLNSMHMVHLIESLKEKYKDKKIELENIVDPTLIGGIQIISGGESLDISLKNSLNKLKEAL